MILAVIVAGLCAVTVVFGMLWWLDRRPADRIVADHTRRDVLVTCKTGTAFRGVLFDADDTSVELRQAVSAEPGGATVGVDGAIVIFRADVAYMQFP